MDVSVFEAEDGDCVTWTEALQQLPDGIRIPVHHAALVGRRIGGLVLLIVSVGGCVIALVLMLAWIVSYWLLTHLFFKTAALLRIVYEVPASAELSLNGVEKVRAANEDRSNRDAAETIVAASETTGHKVNNTSITSTDMDLFEMYLNSNGAPQGKRSAVFTETGGQYIDDSDSPTTREEALAKILRQEEELNAKIQVFAANTLSNTLVSPSKDTSDRAQSQMNGKLGVAQPSLTPVELKKQKKDAEQKAFVQRLTGNKDKGSLDPNTAGGSVRTQPPQQTRTVNPGPIFTAEQLAEAASFAKAATRGHSSGRSTVKVSKGSTSRQQPAQTFLNTVNAARSLDPRIPHAMNFSFDTTSSSPIPPHLRKLNELKAAKGLAQTNSPASASASRSSPDGTLEAVSNGTEGPKRKKETNQRSQSQSFDLSAGDEGGSLKRSSPEAPAKSTYSKLGSQSGYEEWQTGATNAPLRRPLFEKLLESDAEAQDRRLGERAGDEGEPASLEHEAVPALTTIADRIDELKSLNPRSKQQGADLRQTVSDSSFLGKIEQAIRIIAGKYDTNVQKKPRHFQPYVKNEHTHKKADGELPNDVDTHHSEDASRRQQSRQVEQGADCKDNGSEGHNIDGYGPPRSHQPIIGPANDQQETILPDEAAGDAVSILSDTIVRRGTPRVPILSQQSSSAERRPSVKSPDRKPIIKQIADGLQKSIWAPSNSSSSTAFSINEHNAAGSNQKSNKLVSRAPEITRPKLCGLELSTESATQSPPPRSSKGPSFQPTVQAFAPSSTSSAPQTTPAKSGHMASMMAAPLAHKSMPTSHLRTSTVAQSLLQFPASSSGLTGFTTQYVAPAINGPPGGVLPHNFTYTNPYGAPGQNWDTHMYQHQAPPSYEPFTHSRNPMVMDPHFSAFQSAPTSAPVAALQVPPRPKSTSKAIPILKPPEVEYNKDFPQLPLATKASRPELKPPPGLIHSHGVKQGTFDALLSKITTEPNIFDGTAPTGAKRAKGAKLTTQNPFDALLSIGNSKKVQARTNPENRSVDTNDRASTTESESSAKANRKKRKQARAALMKTWYEREDIRRMVAATYTLDGARGLEYATKTYNDKRMELAASMASGELRKEDATMFPYYSSLDLSVPKVRPPSLEKSQPEEDIDRYLSAIAKEGKSQVRKIENKAPKKTDNEINELKKKAFDARNRYVEAHAFFTRPPPQGRTAIKDLRAQGEARIERAAKLYSQARDNLTAAYGGALPREVARDLWTYDDKAEKKDRDAWL